MNTQQDIFVWNCRSAANTSFYRYCKQCVSIHKPKMLVIVETRCEPLKLKKVFNKLGCDGFLATKNHSYAGVIVAVWIEDDMTVTLI